MTTLPETGNYPKPITNTTDAYALTKIEEALKSNDTAIATQSQGKSPNDWSPRDTMTMSGAVLAYSLIVLLFAAIVARSMKTPELAIRLFTTVLIINSAVFFIVAGYSSQQIAPAFGLLGTMAGYVLGKSQSRSSDQEEPKP